MFHQLFLGNTLRDWLIALCIVLGAFLLCRVIVLVEKWLRRLSARSKTKLDDVLLAALMKPLRLGIMLVAIWIAIDHLHVADDVKSWIGKAYTILTALNVTWFFAQLAGGLFSTYGKAENALMPMLRRMTLILVWLVGGLTALNNAGINLSVLLGGLGIGGMAAALAAQDTIKNIFGGFTILTDKPFRIGDTIRFGDIEGTVTDIGLRSTRVQTYEGRTVTIPNCTMLETSLVNISSEPHRRVLVKIGLTYDTSAEKMREAIDILKAIPREVEEVDSNAGATFTDFGDSAMLITFIYYVRKGCDIRESMSKVNFAVLQRFNDAGLSFAFPSQTIYIAK